MEKKYLLNIKIENIKRREKKVNKNIIRLIILNLNKKDKSNVRW
jgi:hypothetical protein